MLLLRLHSDQGTKKSVSASFGCASVPVLCAAAVAAAHSAKRNRRTPVIHGVSGGAVSLGWFCVSTSTIEDLELNATGYRSVA